MKKYLFPIVLAVPLAIAACSDTATEEPTPAPSSTSVETTSAAPTGPVEVELGETINLTQDANGARDIDLTIDDITISDQCHTGLNGHTDEPDEGGYYIRMIGEMDVKQSQTNFSFSETSLTALDEENFTIEVTPAFACTYPNDDLDGYQWFDSPIDEGQKARGVLEFWVADVPEKLSFTEPYEPLTWVWEVPEADISEGENATEQEPTQEVPAEEPEAVQEQAPPAQEQAPVQQEPTITSTCATDFTLYQPGTTFYSDGTSGYTAECQQQMEQAMRDSGQFPDYPYGQF